MQTNEEAIEEQIVVIKKDRGQAWFSVLCDLKDFAENPGKEELCELICSITEYRNLSP
jgi:hypothetical protein